MNNALKIVLQAVKNNQIDKALGHELIRQFENANPSSRDKRIAVIGVGYRFPKCDENGGLWEIFRNGINTVDAVSKQRRADISRYFHETGRAERAFCTGSFLERTDGFDYAFFGIPPKEAALMSPVQRLFLETAVACIKDAGCYGHLHDVGKIGTYVGYADYLYENYGMMIHDHCSALLKADKLGNVSSMLLKRLYRFLDIEGPSMLIDTACSSSMTSIIEACDGLRNGEIDAALAGGIRINNLPVQFHETNIGVESSDAITRTFDDKADGAGIGEGVGFVMLKRLSDAAADHDRIYAVIDGYSISTEGGGASLTAPTVRGQKSVILDAWNKAGISPEDIGYIELHGTGTRLGDGIEFRALEEAFREKTNKVGFCAVGSAKTNFGHLHEAASILSFIKCIYILNYRTIPRTLNFTLPNAEMDLLHSALYVNTRSRKWNSEKNLLIGINSFGLSGTNCHLVLEEYPENRKSEPIAVRTPLFQEKRCWYSDYIPESKIQAYQYLWRICDNHLFRKTKRTDKKYIYICSDPAEKERALIRELKRFADIRICTYAELEQTDLAESNVIFSFAAFRTNDVRKYDRDRLILICKTFFSFQYTDNHSRSIRFIGSNIFSINTEPNEGYANSIYAGYISVLAKELGFGFCTVLDSDLLDPALTAQALLLAEEKYLAIRGSRLYERVLSEAPEPLHTGSQSDRKVFAVIGGASGIGRECVRDLVKKDTTAAVAVIGRRSVGDAAFISSDRVRYYQADICRIREIDAVFRKIRNELGPISCIINSAGTERDELLLQRENDHLIYDEVLAPKVIGNENIIAVGSRCGAKSFILFSSIAAVFPMIGQSDYTAANMYCEAMTDYYRSRGLNVRCLPWNTWAETGMAFRRNMTFDTIFKRLPTLQGIAIFNSFLSGSSNAVLSGELNGKTGRELLCSSGVKLSRELADRFGIETAKAGLRRTKRAVQEKYIAEPEKTVEENIFGIVNSYLGYEHFDAKDSLFELGIDSVTFVKIRKQLSDVFHVELSIAEIVENCSVSLLTELIRKKQGCNDGVPEQSGSVPQGSDAVLPDDDCDIAVIGCSAMLPGCSSSHDVTELLSNKNEFDSDVKGIRQNDIFDYLDARNQPKEQFRIVHGSMFERIDLFDAAFFGISPGEAAFMSPVQRMSLENAYHAIEDAGYASRIRKTNTAVLTAFSLNPKDSYGAMILELFPEEMTYAEFGNTVSVISGRISHYFDLTGPAMNIDSACSSSVTALYEAMNGLRNHAYDYAVVQGIKLHILPIELQNGCSIGTMSADGKTRVFDAHAEGYGIGEGLITLVLKRKKDAEKDRDHIYALLKGCAVNHNGNGRSIAAPSKKRQAELLQRVMAQSGLSADDIDYAETHGTATVLGDSIEFEALCETFQGRKKGRCPLGTLKGSVGHLSEASGMLSVYKTILMFQTHLMFPNVGMTLPNTQLDIIRSPFFLNSKLRKWDASPKTVLINCLGVNGTNAQLIMQSYEETDSAVQQSDSFAFLLSARSPDALKEYCRNFFFYLSDHRIHPADLSFTLCCGKELFDYRIAFPYRTQDELLRILKAICDDGFDRSGCFINFESDGRLVLSSQAPDTDTRAEKQCFDFVYSGRTEAGIPADRGASVIPVPLYPFARKRAWLPLKKEYYYTIHWSRYGKIPDFRQPEQTDFQRYIIVSDAQSNTDWMLRDLFNWNVEYSFYPIDRKELTDEVRSEIENGYPHFVCVIPQASEPENISGLEAVQERGIRKLNDFLKILIDTASGREIRLTIVTEQAISVRPNEQNYLHSAVHGFGMCLTHEYPNLKCCLCDVDSLESFADHFQQIVNQDINPLVAVRDGELYVRTVSKKRHAFSSREYAVKRNAVYLITGASGGIGSCIAEYLLNEGASGLILIDSDRTESFTKEKQTRIERFRSRCSFFRHYAMNVGDELLLRNVFQDIQSSGVSLKGIFHCAGRADAGLAVNSTPAQYDSVFSSKVCGSWLIEKLSEEVRPDFVLFFSSEICTNGEAGMSLYTAGNFFMNELANACSRRRSNVKSFMFTTWHDVGMGMRSNTNLDLIFRTMSNQQALSKMFRSLPLNDPGIIIGDLNEEMLPQLADKLQNAAFQLDFELREHLSTMCSEKKEYELIGDIPEKSRSRLISGAKIKDVTLRGAERFSLLQKDIGICYAKVLGYDEIDIHTSFFELGGDSILMTRLHLLMNERYPQSVTLTDLYAYNTVYDLSVYLEQKLRMESKPEPVAGKAAEDDTDGALAVIGYSFDFPSCHSDEDLLELLEKGCCTVRNAPQKRRELFERMIETASSGKSCPAKQRTFKEMSYLSDIAAFDYRFFGYEKADADRLEPVQRLLLQGVYHAMEHAGYKYADFCARRKLYYLAYSAFSEYSEAIRRAGKTKDFLLLKNQASFICGEIADRFGCREEAAVIDTACSSALTALHLAADRICGTDQIAVISGVNIDVSIETDPARTVGYESADGITRALDACATGAGAAEGTATVILKDLNRAREDGDYIHGVILSSAVGSSGYSAGITVPDQRSEENVIEEAWRKAGIDPKDLDYIELHGSGTPVGDVIEFNALKNVFEKHTHNKDFCAVGTIKNNIGHSFECAGLAGLLKILVMLKARRIFPLSNLTVHNRQLDLIDSALYIGSSRSIRNKCMICGLSSFGISGVNCHAVITGSEANSRFPAVTEYPHILKLSAKTQQSLMRMLEEIRSVIQRSDRLAHITYTLNVRRDDFDYRLCFVFADKAELLSQMQRAGREQISVCIKKRKRAVDSDALRRRLRRYRGGHYSDRRIEQHLKKMYLLGESVPWDLIYNKQFQVTPLPGYAFEKDECWIS